MTSLCTEGMNCRDEIGIARESLQGGGLISSEACGMLLLLHLKICEVEPRQHVFEGSPDPLNRVQLRGIGW
jgi:hypothetical protein